MKLQWIATISEEDDVINAALGPFETEALAKDASDEWIRFFCDLWDFKLDYVQKNFTFAVIPFCSLDDAKQSEIKFKAEVDKNESGSQDEYI